MKWDNSFTLGIDAIDRQHKQIFKHLLAIENSVAKKDPWNILHFFVTELTEYLKFHLAVEEALLEIIRYPDRERHHDAHARLIDQVAKLEEQLKTKGSVESLVGFFEDWFVRHVLAGDREYAAFIAEKFPELAAARSAD